MEAYFNAMESLGEKILSMADPDGEFTGHTKGWAFIDFSTAITIAFAYLAFVIFGSAIMKAGVPAMDPYPIKFIYNVSQIFLCAYMTIEAFMIGYRNSYTPCCNDYVVDAPPMGNLLWLFYVSKIWDFWDTIFIVLGKKWRQLSFLHVYHHFTIFLFYWLNVNSQYDGDVFLTIVLNGFIHTVMYTYYFICMHTKDPKTGKSLPIWWKSSLTSMQLIQFISMMSQAIYLLTHKKCTGHSYRITATYFVYILTLFFLFAQFFVASYIKPKKSKKKSA
jgi:elongation of very long chain fatty acids protein 4